MKFVLRKLGLNVSECKGRCRLSWDLVDWYYCVNGLPIVKRFTLIHGVKRLCMYLVWLCLYLVWMLRSAQFLVDELLDVLLVLDILVLFVLVAVRS